MKENYQRCLANTLRWEGGFANHPADPGGATMRGVTQRVYNDYRRRAGKAQQSVRHITEAELQYIYATGYWNPVAGDAMAKGLDQIAFDGAVNSGPSRGLAWVAKALGVPSNKTIVADASIKCKDKVSAVKKACSYRMGFVRGLRTWSVFGKGWARRIATMEALGVKMVLEAGNYNVTEGLEKQRDGANTSAKKNAASGTASSGGAVAAPVVDGGFDWVSLGIMVLLAAVAIYAVFWYRNNRARVEAYTKAIKDELETSWEKIKMEL